MNRCAIASLLALLVILHASAAAPSVKEGRCLPSSTWTEDCNACICDDNGEKHCTLLQCPSHVEKRSVPRGRCVPGTTTKMNGYSCICTSSRSIVCFYDSCIQRGN